MTAPEFDPIEAAESAAVDFMVERSINEILAAMVPVHVEFIAGDNVEARRLLANIHARLEMYNPQILARCITDLLDHDAHYEANRLHGELNADLDAWIGPTATPADIARNEFGICPGHHVASETSWWERAKGVVRKDDGTCSHCGRPKR